MAVELEMDSALKRSSVQRALRLAAGHMNVSTNEKITEASLLACLRDSSLDGSSGDLFASFLTETDLATICDLVVSGAVTYDQLAKAAAVHLPTHHPTREWLDDRAAH